MGTSNPEFSFPSTIEEVTTMSNADHIRVIAVPVVEARGFVTYDIEQQGPVVRVTVTAAEGGATPSIDDISGITREISRVLDEADPIAGRYTLEVSSPGLERVLRTPVHFAGAIGETVSIKIRRSDSGARRLRGELKAATDDHVVVAVDGPEGLVDTELAYDDIDKARTVFEWGPTTRPGGKGPAATAPTRRPTP